MGLLRVVVIGFSGVRGHQAAQFRSDSHFRSLMSLEEHLRGVFETRLNTVPP